MKFLQGKSRDDDLVLLARFQESTAAHSIRILLEAHGIQASVVGEGVNDLFGMSAFGHTGLINVELVVHRAQLEEAKTIMDEVPAAADSLIDDWVCACGAEVDQGFSVCWSCGGEHREINE